MKFNNCMNRYCKEIEQEGIYFDIIMDYVTTHL